MLRFKGYSRRACRLPPVAIVSGLELCSTHPVIWMYFINIIMYESNSNTDIILVYTTLFNGWKQVILFYFYLLLYYCLFENNYFGDPWIFRIVDVLFCCGRAEEEGESVSHPILPELIPSSDEQLGPCCLRLADPPVATCE